MRVVAFAFLTPFFFLKGGMNVSASALWANLGILALLFVGKMVPKFAGVYPLARRYTAPHAMFTTLLMSTGLTFGTITSLYGLNARHHRPHAVLAPDQRRRSLGDRADGDRATLLPSARGARARDRRCCGGRAYAVIRFVVHFSEPWQRPCRHDWTNAPSRISRSCAMKGTATRRRFALPSTRRRSCDDARARSASRPKRRGQTPTILPRHCSSAGRWTRCQRPGRKPSKGWSGESSFAYVCPEKRAAQRSAALDTQWSCKRTSSLRFRLCSSHRHRRPRRHDRSDRRSNSTERRHECWWSRRPRSALTGSASQSAVSAHQNSATSTRLLRSCSDSERRRSYAMTGASRACTLRPAATSHGAMSNAITSNQT